LSKLRDELVELMPEFELIQSIELRQRCLHVWEMALEAGGWEPRDLLRMPFTLLLEDIEANIIDHTRLVTKICIAAKDLVKHAYMNAVNINDDHMIAGALLHDVGKLLEIGEAEHGKFVKTASGKLLRHPFSGVGLCYKEGIPEEVIHAVACHSKEGEGQRKTPEAIILHHADFIAFETLK
jgi:putative nucleotidyltransferase with HDIG domain